MLELYTHPMSPCAQKVRIVLAEKDLDWEKRHVNLAEKENLRPEYLKLNPLGVVPTLVDGGKPVIESSIICEYLEDRFPDGALLDGSPEARARARDVERIVDLRVAGPMGAYGHAKNSPLGRPPDPEKAAQMEASVQVPLDYLEGLLDDGRPLLLGERVSIADCTLAASLQFLRFVEADLFGDRPLLRAWDERYRARPAAQSVLRW